MKPLHRTGLPQFDEASFSKGLSDGFHGNAWWPGAGTEPLSYAVGYQEAGAYRTESSDPSVEPPQVTLFAAPTALEA
jgi:hypothetical protein